MGEDRESRVMVGGPSPKWQGLAGGDRGNSGDGWELTDEARGWLRLAWNAGVGKGKTVKPMGGRGVLTSKCSEVVRDYERKARSALRFYLKDKARGPKSEDLIPKAKTHCTNS